MVENSYGLAVESTVHINLELTPRHTCYFVCKHSNSGHANILQLIAAAFV